MRPFRPPPSATARGAQLPASTWVLAALGASAWLALWLWGASPYAHYLDHGAQLGGGEGWLALSLFMAGWALMVAGMMLPTTTGLLRSFAMVVRGRRHPGLLQALVALGLVGLWLGVGFLIRSLDQAVHGIVANVAWLQARPRLLGAGALALAGLYQLTPLKHRCLTACRTPRSFVYRHWRGERPAVDAVRIGLAYGQSCVGCCWALMVVMFALGSASIAWMLGMGVVMAVEKTTAAGPRLATPVGLALVGLSIVTTFTGWPT